VDLWKFDFFNNSSLDKTNVETAFDRTLISVNFLMLKRLYCSVHFEQINFLIKLIYRLLLNNGNL
jgi:hypothetical protein